MADINQAVQFVLLQEDSHLSGDVTQIPGDRGGRTRFGLAERWHPALVEQGFFDVEDGSPKIPNEEALAIAEKVYEEEYAAPLSLAEIDVQGVADRVLSFAVNEGPREATLLLQRALNSCGCNLSTDGVFGPATLAAVNAANSAQLIPALRAQQAGFYRRLVATQPRLLPELQGFLNRANA